jgi:hypothetical protein
VLLRKRLAFLEAGLVVADHVSKVDLQPHQTAGPERLLLAKSEETTAEIVADGAQVRRNWISAATEVDVVRQVKNIVDVLRARNPRSDP